MSEPGPSVAEWFGMISDLLRQRIAAMPKRDLVVASRIQRALVALDVQTRLVAQLSGRPPPATSGIELTGRELAVVDLRSGEAPPDHWPLSPW
jgi:hypothetical protein